MASDRPAKILRSKTNLPEDQIAQMSDAEAWKLIYTMDPPKNQRPRKNRTEICFTGFSPSDKDRLEQLAVANGIEVVKSVTKTLTFLVTGANAGPSKTQKAQDQKAIILTEDQFMRFLDDGTIPS